MIEIKVVITLAPEVLSLLSELVGAAKSIPSNSSQKGLEVKIASDESGQSETESIQTDEKGGQPSVSVVEIRALTKKAAANDREAVKKLLSEFEASSVTALNKKHYEAFYKKVGELI